MSIAAHGLLDHCSPGFRAKKEKKTPTASEALPRPSQAIRWTSRVSIFEGYVIKHGILKALKLNALGKSSFDERTEVHCAVCLLRANLQFQDWKSGFGGLGVMERGGGG